MTVKLVRLALATALSILSCGSLPAQFKNPIQAAKDALKKAEQQTKAGQPAQPGQPPQPGQAAQPGQPAQPGQQAKAGPQAPATGSPAANETGAFTPPPGTKIEATLLSAPLPGASFTVSPVGVHMATVTHSGSRSVVLYDNVEGPKFDQLMTDGPSGIAFSPDGSHFAYCGQQGNEAVVFEDGKELWRTSETPLGGGIYWGSCGGGEMHFSSNSKHLYFLAANHVGSTDTQRVVFDGQAHPAGTLTGPNPVLVSPDGDHYAYVWGDPANRGNVFNYKLIIDGKAAPYMAGPLQWSGDSKHLYSSVTSGGTMDVLMDGKSMTRANNIRLFVPPAGDMTVAVITRTQPPGLFLAAGNRPVPGSEMSGQGGIQSVAFSRDGKHYAAQYEDNSHQRFVLWDGKKGLTYRNLLAFKGREERDARYFDFTPDGRVIYLADSQSAEQYLVVGDKESATIRASGEVVVSANGHVMINSAGNATNSAGIVLDGKYLQLPYANSAGYLGFSPDGNHYAFLLTGRDANLTAYLDGVAQPNTVAIPAGSNTAYAFSPDSKHFAYFYRAENSLGICLDGKCIAAGNSATFYNLTFSADSNHLFWIKNSAGHYRLFVDGKPVLDSASPSAQTLPKETFQTIGPSGLLVLAHDSEGYKRISITPPPDSSLATIR
jgi:Tol biopolymer transport system component